MATREEIVAALRRKGYQGAIPDEPGYAKQGATQQAPVQPVDPQGQVAPMLNQLFPQKNFGHTIADSISILGGGKPIDLGQDAYSKAYAEQAAKQAFEDPYDKELKREATRSLIGSREAQAEDRQNREGRIVDFESRRQAGNLRQELNQNPQIKRYREMIAAGSGIDAILQDTLSRPDLQSKNVGDQALITLYNKILDPLSVVRESEYARTPEGQSLLNRIQGFAQKVQAGGSGLTDQDRIEVARAAKVLMNNSGQLYNQQLDQYRQTAAAYQVPEDMVFSGFTPFTPYDLDKQYGVGQVGQQMMPSAAPTSQVTPQGSAPQIGQTFMGKPIKNVRKVR